MMRRCEPADLPRVMEIADKAWRGINGSFRFGRHFFREE